MSIAAEGKPIAPLDIQPGDVILASAASQFRLYVRETFRGHPSRGREVCVVILDEPFKGVVDTISIPWSSPITRYETGLEAPPLDG